MKNHDILPSHYIATAVIILTRSNEATATREAQPITLTQIRELCKLACAEIEHKKHSVLGVSSEFERAIFHGLRILKNADLINIYKDSSGEFLVEINEREGAKQSLSNRFELRYMANNVLLFLASESLIALALNRL